MGLVLVGLGLFATCAWTFARRSVRSRLGGLAALSLALYLSQALLGALTVWKLLDPSVVSGHLAVGLRVPQRDVGVARAERRCEREPQAEEQGLHGRHRNRDPHGLRWLPLTRSPGPPEARCTPP